MFCIAHPHGYPPHYACTAPCRQHAHTVLASHFKSKSNSKLQTAEEKFPHHYQCFLFFVWGCGGEIIVRRQSVYTHAIKYPIWYMLQMYHICAKAIDTLSMCFSYFLFSVQMCNRVREMECFGGKKALKPFLLFVAEPRFSTPLSFLFHDIVCFLEFKA